MVVIFRNAIGVIVFRLVAYPRDLTIAISPVGIIHGIVPVDMVGSGVYLATILTVIVERSLVVVVDDYLRSGINASDVPRSKTRPRVAVLVGVVKHRHGIPIYPIATNVYVLVTIMVVVMGAVPV